jgi:aminoglycoside 6'-N-acetyltransferase
MSRRPRAPRGSPAEIAFRPLARADFPRLRAWLEEPLVARWWNHETSDAALERDFGPSLDGGDPAEFFVAIAGGVPFGLIQRYPIAAYAEYAEELAPLVELAPGALSIDYLIGVPGHRGRGVGAAMIAAFAAECWTAYPGATEIVVPVAAGNAASWRALERAGFRRVAEGDLEPDNPIDPPDHVVYALGRP